MKRENKAVWTLREVSDWVEENSEVQIPALQRGLVWKPQQVELLWDSILRQFPIGAFTLTLPQGEGNQPYELLDGQQRANAIALGYGSVESARSILWFDLKPEEVRNTTRKYFVRVTTVAHPWGYEADDDCSRLNTLREPSSYLLNLLCNKEKF